jgi:hypothetical protein
VFNGFGDVVGLAMGIGELFVGLALLIFILVFLAQEQELGKVFDRADHIPLLFADGTDLLVTVGLRVHVVSLLCDMHTLLVELKSIVVVALVLVFFSDLLVDAYQVLQNFYLDPVQISFCCLFQRCLELSHSFVLVEHVLLAETEAFMGKRLTFKIFEVERNFEATIMEVRGGAVVFLLFIASRHRLVNSEAVAELTLAPVHLGTDEVLPKLRKHQLVLFLILGGFSRLFELEVFNVAGGWLDLARSRLLRQVEEVDVRLHVAFGQERHAECLLIDLVAE